MWILIIWCFGVPGTDNPVTMTTATFHSRKACVAAATDITKSIKEVTMVGRCYEDPR
jgi:hypothetical protein